MRMNVAFSETGCKTFKVRFDQESMSFNVNFGQIQRLTEYVGGDPYEGEYAVTPKVDAQTMPTRDKVMMDDVTVKAIPYYEVSNNAGGDTVYIGSEVM